VRRKPELEAIKDKINSSNIVLGVRNYRTKPRFKL